MCPSWENISPLPEDVSPSIRDGTPVAVKLMLPPQHRTMPFERFTTMQQFTAAREAGNQMDAVCNLSAEADVGTFYPTTAARLTFCPGGHLPPYAFPALPAGSFVAQELRVEANILVSCCWCRVRWSWRLWLRLYLLCPPHPQAAPDWYCLPPHHPTGCPAPRVLWRLLRLACGSPAGHCTLAGRVA